MSSRLSAGSPAPARRASPLDHPVLLVALAVGSVVALALAMPAGAVLRDLALPDNDDAMRLVQVLDLVRGQGWFDKVQHRYGPPAGALTHWSRLVDLPLAGGIGLLSPLLGERLAAGLVAAAWPLCLLVLYAALIGRTALAWYGRRTAWLSIVAITQLATIGLFAPGRIDHHGLQALAVAGFLVALATPAGEARRAGRLGAVAGLLAALSLAIGLETAPFVALAGLAATLAWSADLPGSRPRLVAFGAALALGAPLLFASETLPSAWLRPSCDALSSPWLALAILGGAGAAGLGLASGRIRGPAGRLAGAALVGAAALGAFAAIAPHCLRGPFADLPAIVRREWLARVLEALPIGDAIRISPDAVLGGILPLALATLLMARRAATASGETRARDALLAATFGLGALIATVQMRGIYVASCLLPLAAASALDRAATRVAARGAAGPALAAVAVALLLFGKVASLPALLLPAGPAAAAGRAGPGCADGRTLAALDRMEPGLVLAPLELGTSILLFTRHAILAAPYHRETAGLAAALEGFGGGEADLKAAVARTGATIVALCTGWDSARHGMGLRLAGSAAPAWLDPALQAGDLLAWRVRPLP